MNLRTQEYPKRRDIINLRTSTLETEPDACLPWWVKESKDKFKLRNKLDTIEPKIISTEFIYRLDVEFELFNLFREDDFKDTYLIEIDEYSSNYKSNYKKEIYFVFNQKPDISEFQEKVKEVLKNKLPIYSITISMSLVEEKIIRENVE